jgi:hypothetical protein
MAEASKDATILIATSWQALNRAIPGPPITQLCDCTAVILFANFFIEANLNEIIDRLHMRKTMISFLNGKADPGLEAKLSWFYNEFVARTKLSKASKQFNKQVRARLRRRYPGYAALYRFRNDIAHGKINATARSLRMTVQLRQQAKDIVDDLFRLVSHKGYSLKRDVSYQDAIA